MEYVNRILLGNNKEVLQQIPAESVQVCCTSPPYYGLRKYKGEPTIWDADPGCQHEWSESTIAPTKIARYGSTETIKNPALVKSMKNGGQNHPDNPPNVGANSRMQESKLRRNGV